MTYNSCEKTKLKERYLHDMENNVEYNHIKQNKKSFKHISKSANDGMLGTIKVLQYQESNEELLKSNPIKLLYKFTIFNLCIEYNELEKNFQAF